MLLKTHPVFAIPSSTRTSVLHVQFYMVCFCVPGRYPAFLFLDLFIEQQRFVASCPFRLILKGRRALLCKYLNEDLHQYARSNVDNFGLLRPLLNLQEPLLCPILVNFDEMPLYYLLHLFRFLTFKYRVYETNNNQDENWHATLFRGSIEAS